MKLPIPEQLDTERLSLSRLKYEEAEEIFYAYASKPEATRFMSWATHQNLEDTRAFLKYAVQGWARGTNYSFGIRLKTYNRFVGSCGLLHDEGKIQFGYILSPTQWGQGYATEACRKLMEMLRKLPEIHRIGTFVDAENVASVKVLLKSGLVADGGLEKWFRFVNQDNCLKDCLFFKLPL